MTIAILVCGIVGLACLFAAMWLEARNSKQVRAARKRSLNVLSWVSGAVGALGILACLALAFIHIQGALDDAREARRDLAAAEEKAQQDELRNDQEWLADTYGIAASLPGVERLQSGEQLVVTVAGDDVIIELIDRADGGKSLRAPGGRLLEPVTD